MAFIPSCGWIAAIAANNSARMRRLREEEEEENNDLLFNEGVSFEVNNKNIKFDTFRIDDGLFMEDEINKEIKNRYFGKNILNIQFVPRQVDRGFVEEWVAFVMYED